MLFQHKGYNNRCCQKVAYTQKLESWMKLQKRHRIYQLGSLPPFLLVFGGKAQDRPLYEKLLVLLRRIGDFCSEFSACS